GLLRVGRRAALKNPPRRSAQIPRLTLTIVDQDSHRPYFGERLPSDPIVDEDVAVEDPHCLTRQADHALDVSLRSLPRKMENGDFPPPGLAKSVQEFLNEDSVAAAFERG